MPYKLSRKAEDDIIQIYVSGAQEFGIAQADRYHAGLEEVFAFLDEYPRAARERTEINPPVRIQPYKSHMVVYVIADDGGPFILRIRHGPEDWSGAPLGS